MSALPVFKNVSQWFEKRRELQRSGKSIGFVPTMGALHAGHGSLIARARAENDIVIVSIYVNPTQFDNPSDLEKYPATLDQDGELAAQFGADFVLAPTYPQIYPDDYRYKITETKFSRELCGAHRPGHFDGVLTVVMKLLQIVQPTSAYFGEKDFQQLELVRGMVQAFFLDTKIVACPTAREADGLAMSSRNARLNPNAREHAALFAKILRAKASPDAVAAALRSENFNVDYVEDIGQRRFAAVNLDGVRLIDNVDQSENGDRTLNVER